MKPVARTLNVESTVQGETIGMQIDSSAMAHIMSILTDLYSDPEMAVIREYATNGHDAHVQNGVTRPIEISLPSETEQTLRIRDYGEGLDADDIRNIYSLYGASTKRNSDDVVGMLGLGCKSGLTYTDMFTIIGVKDGVETTVLVSRTEDGGGDMTLVSETPTQAESGVEIIIPVKARNSFAKKAEELFRYWPEGTVLVNGEQPQRLSGFWINDNLLLTEEVDEPMVVMGNVAYPMKDNYDSYSEKYRLVAFVEIGAVQFTPSREALQFTPKTKAVVADVEQQAKDQRDDALRNWINAAEDHRTALQRALVADKIGLKGEIYWGDILIPLTYDFGDEENSLGHSILVIRPEKEHRKRDDDSMSKVPASTLRDAIVFTNFEHERWSPHRRAKLEQWISKQDNFKRPESNFVMVPRIPENLKLWLNDDQILSWEGPEAEKISTKRDAYGNPMPRGERPKDSYEAKVKSNTYEQRIQAEDIDTDNLILYTLKDNPQRNRWEPTRSDSDSIQRKLDPQATVVYLGLNRVAKFQRDFPQAENLGDYNNRKRREFLATLTDTQKLYLTLKNDYAQQYFKNFDATRIDDPVFKRLVEVAKMQMGDVVTKYSTLGGDVAVEYEDPREKYPLLPNRVYDLEADEDSNLTQEQYMDNVYLYMRATYFASLGGGQ